ncbi:MAG: DNA-directed RNA polymerase subunit H [Thaumarchaeota archaeon]|uniref:DNA-directed RNA polymerase subunit Rpo5 n=1 Tax=Thermoproteota archaeon TaxID=2056631 RepID=A0A497EWJ3_9CREN|nr:MAG: DNA-directed RNA polymerase subunit H [Candidatus Verstraetearchaeota archaeon]RLG05509.1 MAG: DNA-directed RNA polymerase subunit H [Nitrososphaerota archaeon]
MGKKFSIFDHELVPQHILLSKEEAKKVLKELGLRPNCLPLLRANDPAARAIGAKPGDIVKIIRRSPTTGVAVVYRYVIPG